VKLTPSTYSSRDRTGKVTIVLITFGLPYWYPNRAIGVVFIGLIAAGMLSSRADVGHVPYVTVWAKPSLPLCSSSVSLFRIAVIRPLGEDMIDLNI